MYYETTFGVNNNNKGNVSYNAGAFVVTPNNRRRRNVKGHINSKNNKHRCAINDYNSPFYMMGVNVNKYCGK